MTYETHVSLEDIAALSALANGVIPADDRDAGAAAVHAGPSIAARMRTSPYADIYLAGLATARKLSKATFDCPVQKLGKEQMHDLLAQLLDQSPAFFRQLRADVCVFYLSDPGVWERIGFPGESSEQGGYPDFDQPQTRSIDQ